MDNLFETPETVSIRYIVDDVKACVKFYTELLGFEVKMNPPSGFAMLTKGNIRLLLNEPGAGGAGQSMPDGTAPEPGGWNRMVFNTPDIHAAVDFLKSKDARFRNEIVEGFGGKQILLLDPSGNLVELVEPKPSIPHSNKGFMMTIITFECSYSGEAYGGYDWWVWDRRGEGGCDWRVGVWGGGGCSWGARHSAFALKLSFSGGSVVNNTWYPI